MPIYRSTGTLTGTIYHSNVEEARNYLRQDDMTQFLDPPLAGVVERIEWSLEYNGHDYYVEAVTKRALKKNELKELAMWTSGQNSDGLGEGFEQQAFAEKHGSGEEVSCTVCYGTGYCCDDHDDECTECGGLGYYDDDGGMISFDWKSNNSTFNRVV
jgi:NAD-dependent SIR2 family protein deacetylase